MLERVETVLTLLISLLGAVTALLTALAQVLKVRRRQTSADVLELEKDIVRLEQAVRDQQSVIEQFRQRHRKQGANLREGGA